MFTASSKPCGTIESAADTAAGKRFAIAFAELAGPRRPRRLRLRLRRLPHRGPSRHRRGGGAHFDAITETLNRSTLGTQEGPATASTWNSPSGPIPSSAATSSRATSMPSPSVAPVKTEAQGLALSPSKSPPSACRTSCPRAPSRCDGVSMTIAEVATNTFTLAVIPTTLEKTTLAKLRVGDQVNVGNGHPRPHRRALSPADIARAACPAADCRHHLAKLQELGMA